MASSYRVYGLAHPDAPDEIRYVGVTKLNLSVRLWGHLHHSAPKVKGFNHRELKSKREWLSKLKEEGREPVIICLEECADGDFRELERKWIKLLMDKYNLFNIHHAIRPIVYTKPEFPIPLSVILKNWQGDRVAKQPAGIIGVSLVTYRSWLKGRRTPNPLTRMRIEQIIKENPYPKI